MSKVEDLGKWSSYWMHVSTLECCRTIQQTFNFKIGGRRCFYPFPWCLLVKDGLPPGVLESRVLQLVLPEVGVPGSVGLASVGQPRGSGRPPRSPGLLLGVSRLDAAVGTLICGSLPFILLFGCEPGQLGAPPGLSGWWSGTPL